MESKLRDQVKDAFGELKTLTTDWAVLLMVVYYPKPLYHMATILPRNCEERDGVAGVVTDTLTHYGKKAFTFPSPTPMRHYGSSKDEGPAMTRLLWGPLSRSTPSLAENWSFFYCRIPQDWRERVSIPDNATIRVRSDYRWKERAVDMSTLDDMKRIWFHTRYGFIDSTPLFAPDYDLVAD